MYVVYARLLGPFFIHAAFDHFIGKMYGSECQWIVPGTVDPRDD